MVEDIIDFGLRRSGSDAKLCEIGSSALSSARRFVFKLDRKCCDIDKD
jgi:hypothetical protein